MIDILCDEAEGKDVAVGGFYFDFAAQKEQSSAGMLRPAQAGSDRTRGSAGGNTAGYKEQEKFIGGRRLQHTDIVKILQNTSSKKLTFLCIDALDDCMPEHCVKLLRSRNRILQSSLSAGMFVTGRPHIRPEI